MRHTATLALFAAAALVCLPPAAHAKPKPIDTEVVDCTDPPRMMHHPNTGQPVPSVPG